MTKIPEQVRHNGFTYKLVERKDRAAIYAQIDENSPVHPQGILAYEVWMVGTFFRIPNDEAFGITAWTYPTLEAARLRMAQ